MSLREQLLKAGLVSKKQAQNAEANLRKQEHDAKKNQEFAQKRDAEKSAELEQIHAEKEHQKELDKERNRARDQLVADRESYYRAIQILNSNSIHICHDGEPYYFLEGQTTIRKVLVTPWQKEMLARGKMGIGRPREEVEEFVLIPGDIAKNLLSIYPSKLILLHSSMEDNEEISSDF